MVIKIVENKNMISCLKQFESNKNILKLVCKKMLIISVKVNLIKMLSIQIINYIFVLGLS